MTTDYSKDLVDIKGKKYQPVASRLRMAVDAAPEVVKRLQTSVIQSCETVILYNTEHHLGVMVRVTIKQEYGGGTFDGVAESDRQARSIEGDSALEVAETSALGRALSKAGIAIDLSPAGFPSADEINNALGKANVRSSAPGSATEARTPPVVSGGQTTKTQEEDKPKILCVDCGAALGKFTDPDGKVYTPEVLKTSREKRFGRVLCTSCVRKLRQAATEKK